MVLHLLVCVSDSVAKHLLGSKAVVLQEAQSGASAAWAAYHEVRIFLKSGIQLLCYHLSLLSQRI